jgi:hypothetical protein
MPSRTSVTSENITAGAGAHQQVGGEADRRIGGHAGEGVAAAALHADHQVGGGAGLAAARVQFQCRSAVSMMESIIDMKPTWARPAGRRAGSRPFAGSGSSPSGTGAPAAAFRSPG